MKNKLKWSKYSLAKHNIQIVIYSLITTLIQFIAVAITNAKTPGDKLVTDFIVAPALIATFIAFLLFWELNSLPFHHMSKKITFRQFISHIIIFSIAISYQFAVMYNTVYILNPNSFQGVKAGGYMATFFDFLYYSVGILSGSSLSDISAVSTNGKIFSMIESLLFFYIIVIIVANYKEIGRSKIGSSIDIVGGNEK